MQDKKGKHYLLFFLDDFHRGAINHVIHFFGFFLLGYGVGKWNLLIIAVSPFVMELGHFYNYARGVHREHAIKIIPLQWLAWIIFIAIGFLVTKFI